MRRIIMDTQNYLLGDAIKAALRQNGSFMVEQSSSPKDTAQKCITYDAHILIMEVTGYTPWRLCERMKIRDTVKEKCPDCKVVLLVDENAEKEVAEQVKNAKKDGLIDMFIYASTSASFLSAIIDSL